MHQYWIDDGKVARQTHGGDWEIDQLIELCLLWVLPDFVGVCYSWLSPLYCCVIKPTYLFYKGSAMARAQEIVHKYHPFCYCTILKHFKTIRFYMGVLQDRKMKE